MERKSKEMKRELIAMGEEEQSAISKLSQDVKELIFAKLSIQLIPSSRMVCKEWNSILSSHSFLSSLPTLNPWFLTCGQEEDGNWHCMAYCFYSQKWRTLSVSFLPNPVGDNIRFLLSAAHGLLLFREPPIPRLCVCNPLMGSYAEIEIDVSNKYIHIVQVGDREPYLVVCSNSENFSFQIYHYFQDSWRIKFQFAEETGSDIFAHEMVECNGVLFWRGNLLRTIVGYNIQGDFINPVTVAPLPPQLVKDRNAIVQSMVAHGSSVLVVGTFKDLSQQPPSAQNMAEFRGTDPQTVLRFPLLNPHRLREGIVIWELFQDKEDKLLWKCKEFAKIPPHSLPKYLDVDWKCVSVGDYLCFSSIFREESAKVFAYNLRERFWQCLPPCKKYFLRKMMSFEPKLNLHRFLRKLRE